MQITFDQELENFVPFTLEDLRNEQIKLKERIDNLRKGFFQRYAEWKKENEKLKVENQELREEVNQLKGSILFLDQESKIIDFKLDVSWKMEKKTAFSALLEIGYSLSDFEPPEGNSNLAYIFLSKYDEPDVCLVVDIKTCENIYKYAKKYYSELKNVR